MQFFYGKGKANEHPGHLVISDLHRPRPRTEPEELQALLTFKMEIDALFEGTHGLSTWAHCRR